MLKKLCMGIALSALVGASQGFASDEGFTTYASRVGTASKRADEVRILPIGCRNEACDLGSASCDAGGCDSAGCGISRDWLGLGRWKNSAGCADNGACGLGTPAGCDGSGCDSLACDPGLLGFGLIKHSETGYDDFISPMTNPLFFEDPRQVTEARAIFVDHKLPYFAAINTPGGRLQAYAVQIRVRLTERLSLIASKDGYVVSQSPLLDDGWADLSAGLKYSLYRNAAAGRLLSVGGRFEMPTGMARTLQGNGDGIFDFFLTGGTRLGNSAHFLSGSGFIIPTDSSANNQMFYWSNHLDKRIASSRVYAFTELNWYYYMKNGKSFPLPVAGGDFFNLGSPGIAGESIVTNAYGLKFKPNRNLETGVAWEFPMTQFRGVLDNRLTADLILRY
jgi:hypothetical protein